MGVLGFQGFEQGKEELLDPRFPLFLEIHENEDVLFRILEISAPVFDLVDVVEQAAFTESIVTGNTIIKEQINNFMDLVPDEIVIEILKIFKLNIYLIMMFFQIQMRLY